MVAAIVIPLLFFYFLWITIKERKKRIEKWENIGNIPVESFVKGKIIQTHKSTYSYIENHHVSKITLLLKTKNGTVKASKLLPITSEYKEPQFKEDDFITCFGYWDNQYFIFKEYNIEKYKN